MHLHPQLQHQLVAERLELWQRQAAESALVRRRPRPERRARRRWLLLGVPRRRLRPALP
ncbi:MAG: hypothetical protein IPM45_06940 [Acidimicrobiales bacterium]|nr:hypothetical protein [Acidimicrobiales bacterium]